ncbi:MAG: ATP-binding cassette domain-containing protein [Alphaproteobacteria bacterium]|jgi:glycerol transport system ATP-binding protein|nr:ATP-binding cassette domain-containing protein [Alphaproteobacteria bacterium]
MTVALDSVTKVVGGETHLYDVSLSLEPAAVNVLLGPTLAGKTSLIRMLAGLDRPRHGRILVDGADVTGFPLHRRNVAMVYQQFINYPAFTVYENIAAPLRRKGLDRRTIDDKVRATAALLHIESFLDRLPGQLSGGQQQRTALARALVKEADLLLLDEPLVNLDYKLREELRAELRQIFERRTATVVYATTEPQEALLMGGTTVIVDAGRVLQSGPTNQVYRNPATTRVGAVFSDPPMNVIPGRMEDGRLVLAGDVAVPAAGHLAALAPGAYAFGVRAHHLFVAPTGPDDLKIEAEVQLAEISGSETFIHVRRGDVRLVVQEEGVHGFRLGGSMAVYLNPARLFAFAEDGTLAAAPGDPRGAAAA